MMVKKVLVTLDNSPSTDTAIRHSIEIGNCIVNGFQTEVESIEGPAKTQLLKHASEWKTDLIVMGNSSRGLLARRVFGDLTMHAIVHSEKPLFFGRG
jgi:nucleotide-binding universal stress UspA family protein